MILKNVFPDTVRRPGAMSLNILNILNKNVEFEARVAPERLKV